MNSDKWTSHEDFSRIQWGRERVEPPPVTVHQDIQTGCLQRLATAAEQIVAALLLLERAVRKPPVKVKEKRRPVVVFAAHDTATLALDAVAVVTPADPGLLSRSVHELNLSARARKGLLRLRIATLGELIQRSADDLLEVRNFGPTSLNEVREKLAALGLKLRDD